MDTNYDGLCDYCSNDLGGSSWCSYEHYDGDYNGYCDYCYIWKGCKRDNPMCLDHGDYDKNGLCDSCGKEITIGRWHVDNNRDYYCDGCNQSVSNPWCHPHCDDNNDGICDDCFDLANCSLWHVDYNNDGM